MAAADYDFELTRTKVIESAFRKVGALPPGGELRADMLEQGVEALQNILKEWQLTHTFLWNWMTDAETMSATTATYNLTDNPKILSVDKAYYRLNDVDTPMQILSFEDYQDIPNKEAPGAPHTIAIKWGPTPVMYVYPVPLATVGEVFYLGIAYNKDADSAGSSPEIKSHFLRALTYGIAADLADDYILPLSERRHLGDKAAEAFLKIKIHDTNRSDCNTVKGAY